MSELKECPFCGHDKVILERTTTDDGEFGFDVFCYGGCGCHIVVSGDEKTAIKAWNTRPADKRITELEAELKLKRESHGEARLCRNCIKRLNLSEKISWAKPLSGEFEIFKCQACGEFDTVYYVPIRLLASELLFLALTAEEE